MILMLTLHVLGQEPEFRSVSSMGEASRVLRAFQTERGMGASDMGLEHGTLQCEYDDRVLMYNVSYNGRVWHGFKIVFDVRA